MAEHEGIILAVGQPFTLFKGKEHDTSDGCLFEVIPEGEFALVVYLNEMLEEEKYHLRKSPIHLRMIEEGDFQLNLFRFGNSPLIFESSFDVNLYKKIDEKRLNDLTKSNMLHVIGVDSSNNLVQTLRILTINPDILENWLKVWNNSLEVENFSEEYKSWQINIDNKYSLASLWAIGKPAGILGKW